MKTHTNSTEPPPAGPPKRNEPPDERAPADQKNEEQQQQATSAKAMRAAGGEEPREGPRRAENELGGGQEDELATSASQAELSSEQAGEPGSSSSSSSSSSPSREQNSDFDDDAAEYDSTDAATVMAEGDEPADGSETDELTLKRRASLMAHLLPENKKLAALLAGRGPISSELKKLAKSSGLSRALAERARRRQRALAKLRGKTKPTSGETSSSSSSSSAQNPNQNQKQTHEQNQKKANAGATQKRDLTNRELVKSMQTRQGLTSSSLSLAGGGGPAGPQSNLRTNFKQLNLMPSGLPQISSAIQRLISGKLGIASGGGGGGSSTAATTYAQLMSSGQQQLLYGNQTAGKRPPSAADEQQLGDFSATSAAGADFNFGGGGPFELTSASNLNGGQQQAGASHQQQQADSDAEGPSDAEDRQNRLAELVSHWQQSASSSEVYPTATGGGLLSLQAAQQRNKLGQASPPEHTSGGFATGLAGKQPQQQQQLIPIEIIGLDPSVTNSILHGSIAAGRRPGLSAAAQQQQQQHLQEQFQPAEAPPGGASLNSSGQLAASELDVHENEEQQQQQQTHSGGSQSPPGSPIEGHQQQVGEEPPLGKRAPQTAGRQQQSPVLHIHHFHHTSGEPPTASNQAEQQQQQQQRENSSAESGDHQHAANSTGAAEELVVGRPATGEAEQSDGELVQVADHSTSGEQSEQSAGRGQMQAKKMRFVTRNSLRGRPQVGGDSVRGGGGGQTARQVSSSAGHQTRFVPMGGGEPSGEDEAEQSDPYGATQSAPNGNNNNNLLMVSYKPAGYSHQLEGQQQVFGGLGPPGDYWAPGLGTNRTTIYGQQGELEPAGSPYEQTVNLPFAASHQAHEPPAYFPQRPHQQLPFNEGSESKSPGLGSGAIRLVPPLNLLQNSTAMQAANLIRSLLLRQQQAKANLQQQQQPTGWSKEDERLLGQFNLANNPQPFLMNNQQQQQPPARVPLLMATTGSASPSSSSSSSPQNRNPFQNHYQQFVDNLAMLRQLKGQKSAMQLGAGQHSGKATFAFNHEDHEAMHPTRPLAGSITSEIFQMGNGGAAAAAAAAAGANLTSPRLTNEELATLVMQDQLAKMAQQNRSEQAWPPEQGPPAHPHHLAVQNSTGPMALNGGRYELTSASDRFASKQLLRNNQTNQQQQQQMIAIQRGKPVLAGLAQAPPPVNLQPQHHHHHNLFTSNENFHVPNVSTSNRHTLEPLVARQQHSPTTGGPSDSHQVAPASGAKQMQTSQPELRQVLVESPAPPSPSSFIDSTNGLSNLALAFIFVVSLLTFLLIAASLIYRRRRGIGSARCGGGSLSGGGAQGGNGSGPKASHRRLNLTQRTKHLMRPSFVVGRSRQSANQNQEATDQSNLSSLKSISQLEEVTQRQSQQQQQMKQQPMRQQQQQPTTTTTHQLKSVLKQPSTSHADGHPAGWPHQQHAGNHNYINKYICANSAPSANQAGAGAATVAKSSRFFNFNPLHMGTAGGAAAAVDKYQSTDETNSTPNPSDTLASNAESDIKTLNTRLAAKAASYMQSKEQQGPSSSKLQANHHHHHNHQTISHKKAASGSGLLAGLTGQRGSKYKNVPGPPPVACLKHAML